MKHLVVALALVCMVGASACTRIGPGYAGIKISNSGSDKGVDQIPKVTGWVFYMPGQSTVLEYPTFMQTAEWKGAEGFTFGSKEGMKFGADINLSYSLTADKVPAFYVQFRNDDLNAFSHGYLRNVAKDAFNIIGPTFAMEDIYGARNAEFIDKVKATINAKVEPYGVKVDQFGLLGGLIMPQEVTNSLNAKLTATQHAQRIENELRSAQAEAAKQVATAEGLAKARIADAEGQAKANEIVTRSLSQQLIQWEQLKIQQKWDGALPTYLGGQMPFMTLPVGGVK